MFGAVASYERDRGAAITMVLPSDSAAWNGKLFITAHGRNRSFKEGTLKAWDKYFDPTKPSADLNKYDLLILAKGFALAKTYRTSVENIGEVNAILDDGTAVDYVAFNESVHTSRTLLAWRRELWRFDSDAHRAEPTSMATPPERASVAA